MIELAQNPDEGLDFLLLLQKGVFSLEAVAGSIEEILGFLDVLTGGEAFLLVDILQECDVVLEVERRFAELGFLLHLDLLFVEGIEFEEKGSAGAFQRVFFLGKAGLKQGLVRRIWSFAFWERNRGLSGKRLRSWRDAFVAGLCPLSGLLVFLNFLFSLTTGGLFQSISLRRLFMLAF